MNSRASNAQVKNAADAEMIGKIHSISVSWGRFFSLSFLSELLLRARPFLSPKLRETQTLFNHSFLIARNLITHIATAAAAVAELHRGRKRQ